MKFAEYKNANIYLNMNVDAPNNVAPPEKFSPIHDSESSISSLKKTFKLIALLGLVIIIILTSIFLYASGTGPVISCIYEHNHPLYGFGGTEICSTEVGQGARMVQICNLIRGGEQYCRAAYSVKNNRVNICQALKGPIYVYPDCLQELAIKNNDINICNIKVDSQDLYARKQECRNNFIYHMGEKNQEKINFVNDYKLHSSITLNETNKTTNSNSEVDFIGKIENNSDTENIYLNGIAAQLSSPELTFDNSAFFQLSKMINPGESINNILFRVATSKTTLPGEYSGTISIQGGHSSNSMDVIASIPITIEVK